MQHKSSPDKLVLPKEADGKEIQFEYAAFQNWGKTIKNKPSHTFYPKTQIGISNIVTWAKSLDKRVRVAAYRHTWTNLFSSDDDILVSLMGYKEATQIPASHKPLDGSNIFQSIELVGEEFKEDGKIKHLCRLGAATTNEQFRTWAMNSFFKNGTEKSWTLPLNVIMVENTIGGTVSLACHGAGLQNKTLSDLVTEIEFINPRGELQTIGYKVQDEKSDNHQLVQSAANAFGMLGIITSLTVKLERLTHAKMKPVKPRLALAVPPPEDYKIPAEVPARVMKDITRSQLKKAEQEFIARCKESYYAEWFWFSLHDKCWVNTWKNDGLVAKSKSYPSPFMTKVQETQEYLAQLSNKTIMRLLTPERQALTVSDAAMLSLPAEKEIVAPLIDALHFQRGIQNMEVQDMEFEIPIPLKENGEPDFSICQRAWWDGIVTVYEELAKGKVPMRLPLEMRVMGPSNATMAPQHGNYGTCSIEVLTLGSGLVREKDWREFMQRILDKWSAYTDFQGKPLNIRPHWAKQWEGLTIERQGEKRKELIEYLKEDAYPENIKQFNNDLATIADKGGYSRDDFQLFSNPLLDDIFFNKKMPDKKIEKSKNTTPLDSPLPSKEESTQVLIQLLQKAQQAHHAKQHVLEDTLHLKKSAIKSKEQSIDGWFNQSMFAEQQKLDKLENQMSNKEEKADQPMKHCCKIL